jgi:adenine-specific DNA-methyltransferase
MVKTNPQGLTQIYNKYRPNEEGILPLTMWIDKRYSATEDGIAVVKNVFGSRSPFDFPKSVFATQDSLHIASIGKSGLALDCFAGSGTTAHALLNLNRADSGTRKYVLIEMGAHFDTILIKRIKKVVYSPDWKEGKPQSRDQGISHAFKIVRLEGYEDTLNNLHLNRTEEQKAALARGGEIIRDQYLLGYFLDVESAGSASLLDAGQFRDPFA